MKTAPVYSSKIIKATALIDETIIMIENWDVDKSIEDNISNLKEGNYFAKASRSRVDDILNIFRQRYLVESGIIGSLSVLLKSGCSSELINRVLYFLSAQSDSLLNDFVIEVLFDLFSSGLSEVSVDYTIRTLKDWIDQGKITSQWSDKTTIRVAQHLLATLRDFGVMEGIKDKRISVPYLPPGAFAYIAFYLKLSQSSGVKILKHPSWKLFFLSQEAVERFFVESHQLGLLRYNAAGSVIRIDFPALNIMEYANVIAEREN